MKPFFTFYGGKWRVAPLYPVPQHEVVVEPFAGSAGYSVRHSARRVILNDLDPIIAGTWRYLIGASEAEILALPDLEPGQTVDDLTVPQEARWLIGWWLNKGSATPKRRPSTFMLQHAAGAPYWGQSIRERIAGQLAGIRHWTVVEGDYRDLPLDPATWFVDPPYQRAGSHYRFGSSLIEFSRLADWCRDLPGQALVCEADDADWLPFRALTEIDGTEGRQKRNRARVEVLYVGGVAL